MMRPSTVSASRLHVSRKAPPSSLHSSALRQRTVRSSTCRGARRGMFLQVQATATDMAAKLPETSKATPPPADDPRKSLYDAVPTEELKYIYQYMVFANTAYADCVVQPENPKRPKSDPATGTFDEILAKRNKNSALGVDLSGLIVGKEFVQDIDNPLFLSVPTNAQVNVLLLSTGELILAFRGTEGTSDAGKIDWLADAMFRQRSIAGNMYGVPESANPKGFDPNAEVHRGFLAYFNALLDPAVGENYIDQAIKNLLDAHKDVPLKKITCVGHSLGGALAKLGAYWCKLFSKYSQYEVSCYTYGAPRVGNKAFTDSFDAVIPKAVRCVHKDDPVPGIPLPSPVTKWWRHTKGGVLLCQPGKNQYTLKKELFDAYQNDKEAYVAAYAIRSNFWVYTEAEDHYQPQYINALISALGVTPEAMVAGTPPASAA